MRVKTTTLWISLPLILIFLLPLPMNAASTEDQSVALWTRDALIATLALDYIDEKKHFATVRPYYTFNAWNAIRSFLQRYMNQVQARHLVLNPTPIGQTVVVTSGVIKNSNFFTGLPYWEVKQTVTIPELGVTIDFVVIVIAVLSQDKYIIQSLNMEIK